MTARTLVLLRHAKAVSPAGVDDVDRPLADRGLLDAAAAGRWLRDEVPGIGFAVCSPAVRTMQTWTAVAAELGGTPAFRADPRIYAASVDELLAVVQDLPEDAPTALLIGHNPGLTELVWELSGSDFGLRTAGIAVVRADADWIVAGRHWGTLDDSTTARA